MKSKFTHFKLFVSISKLPKNITNECTKTRVVGLNLGLGEWSTMSLAASHISLCNALFQQFAVLT